jgi:hypothetical protein
MFLLFSSIRFYRMSLSWTIYSMELKRQLGHYGNRSTTLDIRMKALRKNQEI